MVLATYIQTNGTLGELTVPAKCPDVLEWIRKKLKQPGLQFQGKISEKDSWVTVFAESGSDSDDNINQHILGGNFQEEIFVGSIVVMLSTSSNEDNYDKSSTCYVNLKPSEYETLYSGWTFEDEENDDGNEIDDDECEEENDECEDDDEEPFEIEIEKEKEKEKDIPEDIPIKKTRTKLVQPVQNINEDTTLRELVRKRFEEIGVSSENSSKIERKILERSIRESTELGIDVGWANPIFCNHYRGRCIHLYENMKGEDSYVKNPMMWKEKLEKEEVTAEQLAEMSVVDLNLTRWKAEIEKQIEKDKHLYSNKGCASIYLYCYTCKKKSRCDYYQMQTRSADEPMTTFVTCLECDKRWKF